MTSRELIVRVVGGQRSSGLRSNSTLSLHFLYLLNLNYELIIPSDQEEPVDWGPYL